MKEGTHINTVLQQEVIRYAQVWEDQHILAEGLSIQKTDKVLSIASAGGNALALLAAGACEVVAVDMNPAQIALCRLKKAAIAQCNLSEYHILMGLKKNGDVQAKDIIKSLHLDDDTRQFWETHIECLDVGIVHVGKLERYFSVFQKGFIEPFVPKDILTRYLERTSTAEQEEFFQHYFGTARFAEAFKHYTSQQMIASGGRDPAQFAYVQEQDTGSYFYERFRYMCTQLPARDNFYLSYLLSGHYRDLESASVQYTKEGFQYLKSRISDWHIRHERLDQTLKYYGEGYFQKANLSDLFEYLSEEECNALFEELALGMTVGGRIAYWNLLVPRQSNQNDFTLLEELSQALWKKDRCFFYSIV